MSAESPRTAGDSEDGSDSQRRQPPRDLIDFFKRWSEFRETAIALAQRAGLSPEERMTLDWMTLLIDRIGERDIGPLDSR
jgi:hypothetical protein